MKHLYRYILIRLVNLFKGTHFWGLKRFLLNLAPDIEVGYGTRIVAPIWAGSVSKIYIGENVFVNREFNIEGNGELRIGNNIDFGPNCRILLGGHIIGDNNHRAGDSIIYSVSVGDGCWIGANALILGNTDVGEGVVIAAGSVVIRHVPSNVLVAGNPAQVKKSLYTQGDKSK